MNDFTVKTYNNRELSIKGLSVSEVNHF